MKIPALLSLPLFTLPVGCVGVSLHSTRDVALKIQDSQTGRPTAGAKVAISYGYDSYGWFYFANTPSNAFGTTDASGQANIPISDFRYSVNMRVNESRWVNLSSELIRHGGVISIPQDDPKFRVELSTPAKKNEAAP